MAAVLAEVVNAPVSRGLRYGLFAAATGPADLPEPGGLGNGIQFEPISCGSADLVPVECDDTPPEQEFDDGESYIIAEPFIARATYTCRPVGLGNAPADLEAKVLRRLANGEQTVAEAGMSVVLQASATPLVGVDDPESIRSVVGELEQWLYGVDTANYGRVGVLHASPRVMSYAAFAGLLIKDGPVWITPMGTVWSIGGGYPDGRIYISGTASVWRAVQPAVSPARQVFDRRNNIYRLTADREYAVAFDCVAAYASFSPEIPLS